MAVVVSAGQLEEVRAPWNPTRLYGVALYGQVGNAADYATLYRTQPNVRTVVDFLARNIAQLGLKVYERVGDAERVHLSDHPLARMIRRPNPFAVAPPFLSRRSRYWWTYDLVQDVAVYDEFYAAKVRDPNQVMGLQRIPPQWVEGKGGSWAAPAYYEIRGKQQPIRIDADRMFTIVGHNPDDPRSGLSPLETLRRILAEEAAAGEYREAFWRNAATMGGVIERPADAPDWSPTARARFRGEWEARFTGAGNAGKTPILEDGMTFKQASFSAQESQYLEARRLTREEVASAYHIPPPMVGILEHATYSNISEQHKHLYQDTLGPWLVMIEEEYENQLVPEFPNSERIYVEFNLGEKLRGSFTEQTRAIQSAVGAPWLTRNEGRALQNLAPVDGGDSLVVPLNVLVGGQASPTDTVPPEREVGAAAASPNGKALPVGGSSKAADPRLVERHVEAHRRQLAAHFERQRDAVLRQLGEKARGQKVAVADVFDDGRWSAELAADLLALAQASAVAFAALVTERFGGDFDTGALLAFLRENARIAGANITRTTAEALGPALADDDPAKAVRHIFEVAMSARAGEIARSRVTMAAAFGQTEAAAAAGVGYKRWVVTSPNPRPSHASMANQKVRIGEKFSNGAKWPGDPALSVDQTAGCTCLVDFDR